MAARAAWLCLCVLLAVRPSPAVAQDAAAQARQFWLRGQEAMRRGKPSPPWLWFG